MTEETKTELARFDPKQAVMAFSQTEEELRALAERNGSLVFDVTTTKGMKAATDARAELREPRLAIEKARVNGKADALAYGKEVDRLAKSLTAIIAPVEEAIDSQIKAEQRRKEAERAEKERIEVERIARENAVLDRIRDAPLQVIGKTMFEIDGMRDMLNELDLDGFDPAARERADSLRAVAIEKLNALYEAADLADQAKAAQMEQDAARAREEAEAAQSRAEAEKAAQAAADAERKARQEQEDAERAEAQRKADKARAEEDRLAAERRKALDEEAAKQRAERERLDQEARELADRQAAERLKAKEAEEAARIDKLKAGAPPLRVAAINALAVMASNGLGGCDEAIQLREAIEKESQT